MNKFITRQKYMTKKMKKYEIIYDEIGTKEVPTKWQYGEPIRFEIVPCLYECSEIVDESELKERIKILERITCGPFGENAKKKYINIRYEEIKQ